MANKGLDRAISLSLTALLLTATPMSAAAATAIETSASAKSVQVTSDSAVVLESDAPFSELVIANPQIADISTISGTTLYVLGKQPGRTTLMLIADDGSVMSVIDVRVSPDVTELTRRLSDVLPEENIDVLSANDGIVLSGTVSSSDAARQAIEIAKHYASGKVSNLLRVKMQKPVETPAPAPVPVVEEEVPVIVDPSIVQQQLRAILPDEAISVHELGGTLVLSGNVSSPERAQNAMQIARLAASGIEVSNLLTVAKKQDCTVRTRRGGDLIETVIPCGSSS